jgi:hypothetical protein
MKLADRLINLWKAKSFPATSLVEYADYDCIKKEIFSFLDTILSEYSSVPAENNTDIVLIEHSEKSATNIINIEQIRELQNKFSSTSGITPYKFAFIIGAENLNINASNGLLKILEDNYDNSFIILVCNNPSKLLATINSRTINIYKQNIPTTSHNKIKEKLFKILNPEVRYDDKISDIEKLSSEEGDALFDSLKSTITDLIYKQEYDCQHFMELKNYLKKMNVDSKALLELYKSLESVISFGNIYNIDKKQILILFVLKFSNI